MAHSPVRCVVAGQQASKSVTGLPERAEPRSWAIPPY